MGGARSADMGGWWWAPLVSLKETNGRIRGEGAHSFGANRQELTAEQRRQKVVNSLEGVKQFETLNGNLSRASGISFGGKKESTGFESVGGTGVAVLVLDPSFLVRVCRRHGSRWGLRGGKTLTLSGGGQRESGVWRSEVGGRRGRKWNQGFTGE
ncbi:hypothetical protein H6P81_021089 [Aristolochia fimbriata]|uniref:Uncharacterized protein n=1 Tax=Aristolochia fimbriata TaxID=158543 RepID=A0AAV7DXC6_ARIFI|nr:hypothetical protein H6P81_021089 [Aristolochia fimbriata]